MQSKSGQPLGRYFPELVGALLALPATKFVLDAEIVIPEGNSLSFDALLQRIHPSASRVRKLSTETPGVLVVFDLLVDATGKDLSEKTLDVRRREHFTGGRFRHGTAFLRWRPDKSPKQCTMAQVEQESASSPLRFLTSARGAARRKSA